MELTVRMVRTMKKDRAQKDPSVFGLLFTDPT